MILTRIGCLYLFSFVNGVQVMRNTTREQIARLCGRDKSPINVVYEGFARMETYPWLGVLYYPAATNGYTTPVVLVSRQIVIASAMDIEKIPKHDFRARSRIILGKNCTSKGIKIREYTYHPDFNTGSYSALALIQIETSRIEDLQPICAPPAVWGRAKVYTFTIHDCQKSTLKIYKMAYVDREQCKAFYRKSELDIEKLWATHTVCAKSTSGLPCVWRNGAILAMRQNNRWHLLGFGIYGPGCRAPSRFLDYVQYRPWISSSVARIGRATVTRITDNQIILRRSVSSVQRYGPCEPEEIKSELYTDRTTIKRGLTVKRQRASLNFTIFANLEYSCIIFKVFYHKPVKITEKPFIRLRRWCTSPKPICYSFQHLQVDFAVEVFFTESVTYQVSAYGREVRLIDRKKVMARVNQKKSFPEVKCTHIIDKKNGNGVLNIT